MFDPSTIPTNKPGLVPTLQSNRIRSVCHEPSGSSIQINVNFSKIEHFRYLLGMKSINSINGITFSIKINIIDKEIVMI
jgi:hypothetical protein